MESQHENINELMPIQKHKKRAKWLLNIESAFNMQRLMNITAS